VPSRDVGLCCSILRAALPGVIEDMQIAMPGTTTKPIQTERTTAEQQALYASGRSVPGPWKTDADGVLLLSNHQRQVKHGEDAVHATDLGVFSRNVYLTKDLYYKPLAEIASARGLVSGWSFPTENIDPDHLQCMGRERHSPAVIVAAGTTEGEVQP
jgi:hypothetical protein